MGFVFIFLMSVLSQGVSAADGFSAVFDMFSRIVGILSNQTFVVILTIVLMFILFYGIFSAGLSFVKAFQGTGGQDASAKASGNGMLNKQGKIVAISMAGISTLGLLGLGYSAGGYYAVLQRVALVLTTFGQIAGWVIAALIAVLVFFLYKDLPIGSTNTNTQKVGLALLCFGIAFWVYGNLLDNSNSEEWGFFFTFIGIITLIISIFSGNKAAKGVKDIQNATSSGVGDVNKAAKNAADKAVNDAGEKLGRIVNDLGKQLNENAGKISEEQTKNLQEIGQHLTDSLSKLNEGTEEAKRVAQSLKDTVKNAKNAGLDEEAKVIDDVAKDLEEAADAAKEAEDARAEAESVPVVNKTDDNPDDVTLDTSSKDEKTIEDKGEELAKRIMLEKEIIVYDHTKTHGFIKSYEGIKSLLSRINFGKEDFRDDVENFRNHCISVTHDLEKYVNSCKTKDRVKYRRNHRREVRSIDTFRRAWERKSADVKAVHEKVKEKMHTAPNPDQLKFAMEMLMKDYEVVQNALSHLDYLKKVVLGLAANTEGLMDIDAQLSRVAGNVKDYSRGKLKELKDDKKMKFVEDSERIIDEIQNLLERRLTLLNQMGNMDDILKRYEIDLIKIAKDEHKFRKDLEAEMEKINEILNPSEKVAELGPRSTEEPAKESAPSEEPKRFLRQTGPNEISVVTPEVSDESKKKTEMVLKGWEKNIKDNDLKAKERADAIPVNKPGFFGRIARGFRRKKPTNRQISEGIKKHGRKGILILLLLAASFGIVKGTGVLERSRDPRRTEQQVEHVVRQRIPDHIIREKLERLEREHHPIVAESVTADTILEAADEILEIIERDIEPETLEQLATDVERSVDSDTLVDEVEEVVEREVERQIPDEARADRQLEQAAGETGRELEREMQRETDKLEGEVESGGLTPVQEAEIETKLAELVRNYGHFLDTLPNYSESATEQGVYKDAPNNRLVVIVDTGRNNPNDARRFFRSAYPRVIGQALADSGAVTEIPGNLQMVGTQFAGVFEGGNGNYFARVAVDKNHFDQGTYMPLLIQEEQRIRDNF
jgi:hypothetical protein